VNKSGGVVNGETGGGMWKNRDMWRINENYMENIGQHMNIKMASALWGVNMGGNENLNSVAGAAIMKIRGGKAATMMAWRRLQRQRYGNDVNLAALMRQQNRNSDFRCIQMVAAGV
jgi:hypothetical protein